MKKILIFSLAYYPRHVSGAEAAVKEITDRVTDIEFHMVTLRFDRSDVRNEKLGNVEVHRVGFGGQYLSKILFIPLAVVKARQLHRRHQFEAFWALMTYMLLPVAILRITGFRVPHILTLQDGDPYEKVFERWFIRPMAPLLDYGFRTASVIQVISNYLATWPPKRGYSGPIELVRNGANPRDLADATRREDVEALQRKLGKKDGDIWLVNTARLEYQKAQDDVIRALRLLPPRVKFLIVGGGSDEVKLKELVASLELIDRVIFTGQVDRTEVTLYRKASDIFVAPSRSEGLGNAFLSAMASRLPVVATQEGGLADFIFDAKRNPDTPTTAWAVDADSPGQIAEAVQDILADPEMVREVTDRAREMVVETYDWDKIAVHMRTKVFGKALV